MATLRSSQNASTAKPNESEKRPAAVSVARNPGLLLIACFKLFKTVFFLLVGLGVLHLIHRNLSDVILQAASHLHLDPDGQFVGMLIVHAHLISGHQLRVAGVLSILYACIAAVEGTGLLLQKVWAEYLTLGLTLAALPWELVELVRHTTWVRFSLLGVNLLVIAYLLWFLRRSRGLFREGMEMPLSPHVRYQKQPGGIK